MALKVLKNSLAVINPSLFSSKAVKLSQILKPFSWILCLTLFKIPSSQESCESIARSAANSPASFCLKMVLEIPPSIRLQALISNCISCSLKGSRNVIKIVFLNSCGEMRPSWSWSKTLKPESIPSPLEARAFAILS